uniref:Uncharacterized protein n=1 Tax=Micrurus carvalhoi TaxID=3147026 RepID=A0A2H6N4E0_9SAUR
MVKLIILFKNIYSHLDITSEFRACGEKKMKRLVLLIRNICHMVRGNVKFKNKLYTRNVSTRNNENLKKADLYLIIHIITAAGLSIAQTWKLKEIPSDEVIIKKILHCTKLDSLTLELKELQNSMKYGKKYNWRDI